MLPVICLICLVQAAALASAQLGPFETLNIPVGEALPVLDNLGSDVYLELVPNTITVSHLTLSQKSPKA